MKNNYQDIIEKIVNLFQLSTRDVSIHFHISIQNEEVIMNSFLVQLDGEKTNFQKIKDYWNEEFYHNFLIPFLNLIYQKCSIVKTDIIPSLRKSLFTVRIITKNNDIFTIDGMNQDDSKKIFDVIKKYNEIHYFH
ncbi:MAG: hypothetical protein IKE70_03900 [Bacilli bacterium]|nr:hypothetical protein [Bacilli bacterium]